MLRKTRKVKGSIPRSHKKSLEAIQKYSENLDLVDTWRVLNRLGSRYTWRQRKPEIHCRLNFFLLNQGTFCNTLSADILPGYKTDHAMITIKTALHSESRGPGFWKVNTSFLNDIEYVNKIKATRKETRNEYEKDDSVNPNLLWEMVKMKVREKSMKYGVSKKREFLRKEDGIGRSIAVLEKQLSQDNLNRKLKQKF